MRRVFVLVFLSLFLAGCTGGPAPIEDINFHEGRDGVVMTFMDNSPPTRVFPDRYYPVSLMIENKGAYSLQEYDPSWSDIFSSQDLHASLLLIYDPLYFEEEVQNAAQFERIRRELFIKGKSPYWPEGESRMVTVGMLKAKNLARRSGADAEIMVSMCYPYGTLLTREVCVDADPYNLDERMQSCEAENLLLNDQGAPVAITEVKFESLPAGTQTRTVTSQEPVTAPDGTLLGTRTVTREESVTTVRPVFNLRIENVGDGQVVRARDPRVMRTCIKAPDETYPSSSVKVEGRLGNRELVCNPVTPVFYNDVAETICMVRSEEAIVVTSNYKDILQLELGYVYQTRVTAEVKIEDMSEQYEVIPELPDLDCSDFNNNPLQCSAMGQIITLNNGLLNCFYCEDSGLCADASQCQQCADGNRADQYSRRCVGDCPVTDPRVSASLDRSTNRVTITCSAASDARDFQRCGCDKVYWGIVNNQTDCETASLAEITDVGLTSSGTTADVLLTSGDFVDGVTRYFCARGTTVDNRFDTATVRLSS